MYAQHHAQMLPLSATRYKTRYRNTPQWNFLGCAFKQDPCQRRGTARMIGLVSERREKVVIKERHVNTGNLQCSRTTVPAIRLVSSKIHVLTKHMSHCQDLSPTTTKFIMQHYSLATHISCPPKFLEKHIWKPVTQT